MRSVVSICNSTHAAKEGMSPRATASACALGISWNAWAVMMMAIQSRMPSVHSIGTTLSTRVSPPIRQSRVMTAPFRIEYPRPGAHGLPARMADVDGGGEGAPEQAGRDGSDAVCQERRPGLEPVARRLGAFEVLQAPDHVEKSHGQNDGEVFPSHGENSSAKASFGRKCGRQRAKA